METKQHPLFLFSPPSATVLPKPAPRDGAIRYIACIYFVYLYLCVQNCIMLLYRTITSLSIQTDPLGHPVYRDPIRSTPLPGARRRKSVTERMHMSMIYSKAANMRERERERANLSAESIIFTKWKVISCLT